MKPRHEEECTTNPCKTPVIVLDWIPPYPAVQVSKWENGGQKFTMSIITQTSTTWMGAPCVGFINYAPPAGVEKCAWLAGRTDAEWNGPPGWVAGRFVHDYDGNTPHMF